MPIPFNTLIEEAKCYLCLGISQSEAMELALLNRIAEAGGSEFLVYRALLNQTGGNPPVATILENTIGNIIWSAPGVGDFEGKLNGVNGGFSRLTGVIEGGRSVVDAENNMLMRSYVNPTGNIEITTWDTSPWTSGAGNAAPLTDVLGFMIGDNGAGTYFEIRVYP